MLIHQVVDKRFLNNQPHEGGSICWDVTLHQGRSSGKTNIDAGLDITDCSRKIGLEFYGSTPAKYKERLAKLDNLIDSLTSFREALVDARVKSAENIIKYRQENKGERFKGKTTEKVCED